jgi:hypothetical protein
LFGNSQAVVVTFENDWNVGLIINFSSVIQEDSSSVHSACAQLIHIPLVNSYANTDGVLKTNEKPKTETMRAQIVTWRGANFRHAT